MTLSNTLHLTRYVNNIKSVGVSRPVKLKQLRIAFRGVVVDFQNIGIGDILGYNMVINVLN